ncbi:hypothetical protein EUGRSUZ_E00304 [Eucalyptus grandis]|uniref:Uncharacterized protein n=2 Tax=Eucalyptus grandis TaxID=71139 RepID=A0ACC3KR54_EUCGR|nr:hypothetical protein EUGRSUZ_E00304 [Eucalyptus grandis]
MIESDLEYLCHPPETKIRQIRDKRQGYSKAQTNFFVHFLKLIIHHFCTWSSILHIFSVEFDSSTEEESSIKRHSTCSTSKQACHLVKMVFQRN